MRGLRRGPASGRRNSSDAASPVDQDPLAQARNCLLDGDPQSFAACFIENGTIRITGPQLDITYRGQPEIVQAAAALLARVPGVSWTASLRYLSPTEVIEEGTLFMPNAPEAPLSLAASRPLRIIARWEPGHRITDLTVQMDQTPAQDPSGLPTAAATARALVEQVRARTQDTRGLRVIDSTPGGFQDITPVLAAREAQDNGQKGATGWTVWWRWHRIAVIASVLAVLAVAIMVWTVSGVLRTSPAGGRTSAARPAVTPTSASSSASTTTSAPAKAESAPVGVPIITQEPAVTPSVQAGEQVVLQADVLFESGSPRLSPTARTRLERLVQRIEAQSVRGVIQINGYTDNVGTASMNRSLSQQRALAVANILQRELAGLPVRLMPQGFGEGQPIASNQTADGRQRNRRVTIVLPVTSP
jgi:outer membrane protein OmpA-like peptidoglycan-associated protein